jgi:hypothetical protein
MIMGRPKLDHPYDRMLRIKTSGYVPSDDKFGY